MKLIIYNLQNFCKNILKKVLLKLTQQ